MVRNGSSGAVGQNSQGIEVLATLGAWATFCVALISRAPVLFEADDYAYRASIVALRSGLITLTQSQYSQLNSTLKGHQAFGIYQWTHLSNGNWISEKNPGYAFFAEPFYFLGNLHLAPAFYSLLAVGGLYLGARRWIGSWAGFVASVCFLFTGASLTYGYRVTMPTFTEACLITSALGLLLWSCNTDQTNRLRTFVSSAGFILLGAAVFSRYTNVVIYFGALIVLMVWHKRLRFTPSARLSWLGVTAVIATIILGYNQHFYGGWFKTGYTSQHFSTSLANFPKNIWEISPFLLESMPVLVLAAWGAVKLLRRPRPNQSLIGESSRSPQITGYLLVLCVVLPWGLYFGYDRTALHLSANAGLHVVRFYVPALGALALLAAWQLMRLGSKARVVIIAILVVLSFWSFAALTKQVPPAPGQPGGAPLWSMVG